MTGTLVRYWACAMAGMLLAGCAKKEDPAASSRVVRADATWPNIVLISIDTLRRDHLGCYGYSRPTSPRIDRLAAEGSLLENMVSSSSWTLPAHAAMFTGLADSVHGATEMDMKLPEDRVTLAARLKAIGYTTAGFFSGPTLHPAFGLGRGFDAYVDCTSYPDLITQLVTQPDIKAKNELNYIAATDISSPRVYQSVHDWLTANSARPFFLFIHMYDVHPDFIPPPPYDHMFDPDYVGNVTGRYFLFSNEITVNTPKRDLDHIIALYDGEIAWTDMHVGKILDDLDAFKLRNNTIVVLLADHGEEFFDHKKKGHRHSLFDELIRIPLIVRFPGHVPAGQRFAQQARMIDVPSTLIELAGGPPPDDVMGQSLAPLFTGAALRQDNLAVSELYSLGRRLRSFRRPDRKMIVDEKLGKAIFFDLSADPAETRVLSNIRSPIVQALLRDEQQATRWLTECRASMQAATAPVDLPERVRDHLKSLGYIGSGAEREPAGQEPPPGQVQSPP